MTRLFFLHVPILLLWTLFKLVEGTDSSYHDQVVRDFLKEDQGSGHTNNWAVLVCSSRYWFNYRHMANTLGMYRTVKRLGIPDSNIILMLADDVSCNARNRFPASVYSNGRRNLDLYGENIEVDYRGYEVTVENFLRLLTGRVEPSVPRSKRLLTDEKSNVFVYMTGHGGAEFLKFQDNEEISAFDIADAFEQMWQKKRYHEIFFMIDTCQANTMYSKFYSPNILATGSSELGESSYSYENDADIGVAVIDRYTHLVLSYLENINKTSRSTMQQLFDAYDFNRMRSHAGVRTDLFKRDPSKVLLTEFFGGIAQADIVAAEDVIDAQRPRKGGK
ncbi:glycosylphosphatidylinositol anchor biosynthesis [Serendipita sp. 405]|nr:glycosylphosphatidylinositol anchor biosynthesis [Serendipita sp. 405]